MSTPRHSIAEQADAARSGDEAARESLFEQVYTRLRALAEKALRGERAAHTLQPTDLVHEACLKLWGGEGPDPHQRTFLLGVAAVVMRRVLVDHARARAAAKRGGARERITLRGELLQSEGQRGMDLLELHEALSAFERVSPRAARVVELKYFGGLTDAEIGVELGISRWTVRDDWTAARAWLRRRLGRVAEA